MAVYVVSKVVGCACYGFATVRQPVARHGANARTMSGGGVMRKAKAPEGWRVWRTPCPKCESTAVCEIGYGIVRVSIEWAAKTGNILRANGDPKNPVNMHCRSCGHEWWRPWVWQKAEE